MAKVTYIEHSGTRHTVDVPSGTSAMCGAVDNGIPGIDGDCGGQCACGTCHVYVSQEWASKTGTQTAAELEMLDFAASTQPTSRLACQIEITDALDGLVLTMPDGQH